jgi:hypothetical protein
MPQIRSSDIAPGSQKHSCPFGPDRLQHDFQPAYAIDVGDKLAKDILLGVETPQTLQFDRYLEGSGTLEV